RGRGGGGDTWGPAGPAGGLGAAQTDAAVLARLRNGHPCQQRRVAHGIRRVAVRHLEFQFALVEIDGREYTVWRLDNRQPVETVRQPAAASAAARRRARFGWWRAASGATPAPTTARP